MKIITARAYGFCFGVRDAVAAAERAAREGPLTVLGEIVHNPSVIGRLEALGVVSGHLDQPEPAATRRVLITAHGAADTDKEAWRARGHEVVDTTCPLVRRAHRELKTLVEAGYHPVVIGRKNHVEVLGLTGDFPASSVVESEADLAVLPLDRPLGIISQTTQPLDRVERLVACIRAARPAREVRFCDTVCQPTKDRQRAIRDLCAQCDLVIVVGGRNSNNTRELRQSAECLGALAYHVENERELQPRWFVGIDTVGVTAGTSTEEAGVQRVIARLQQLAASQARDLLTGNAR